MIESSLAMPLYHQVAGIMRQRIQEGAYPVGSQLIPEDALAVEFGVSRATIRQAVGMLVSEGLIIRRHGRGTFVNSSGNRRRFSGSLGDVTGRPKARDIEIIHDETITDEIAAELKLDQAKATVIRRVRIVGNQPFAYAISYLPDEIGRKITPQAMRNRGLLEVLSEKGFEAKNATQSIRAELADILISTKLTITPGSAVLRVDRLTRDRAKRPVEFSRRWYRGDGYEYTIDFEISNGKAGVYAGLA